MLATAALMYRHREAPFTVLATDLRKFAHTQDLKRIFILPITVRARESKFHDSTLAGQAAALSGGLLPDVHLSSCGTMSLRHNDGTKQAKTIRAYSDGRRGAEPLGAYV